MCARLVTEQGLASSFLRELLRPSCGADCRRGAPAHFVCEHLRSVSHFCRCNSEARPQRLWGMDVLGGLCVSLRNPHPLSPCYVYDINSFYLGIMFLLGFMNGWDNGE